MARNGSEQNSKPFRAIVRTLFELPSANFTLLYVFAGNNRAATGVLHVRIAPKPLDGVEETPGGDSRSLSSRDGYCARVNGDPQNAIANRRIKIENFLCVTIRLDLRLRSPRD
jgi:hypothetical protein